MPETSHFLMDEKTSDGLPPVEPKYALSRNFTPPRCLSMALTDAASSRNATPKSGLSSGSASPLSIRVHHMPDIRIQSKDSDSEKPEIMVGHLHITPISKYDEMRPRSRSFGGALESRHFTGRGHDADVQFRSKWSSYDISSSVPHSYNYLPQSDIRHLHVHDLKRIESPAGHLDRSRSPYSSLSMHGIHSPQRIQSPSGHLRPGHTSWSDAVSEAPNIPCGSDLFKKIINDMESDSEHDQHKSKNHETNKDAQYNIDSPTTDNSSDDTKKSSKEKSLAGKRWHKVDNVPSDGLLNDNQDNSPIDSPLIPTKLHPKPEGGVRLYSKRYSKGSSPPGSPKLNSKFMSMRHCHVDGHIPNIVSPHIKKPNTNEHIRLQSSEGIRSKYANINDLYHHGTEDEDNVSSQEPKSHAGHSLPHLDISQSHLGKGQSLSHSGHNFAVNSGHGHSHISNVSHPGNGDGKHKTSNYMHSSHSMTIRMTTGGSHALTHNIDHSHQPHHSTTGQEYIVHNVQHDKKHETLTRKSRWHLAKSKLSEIVKTSKKSTIKRGAPDNESSPDTSPHRRISSNLWMKKRIYSPKLRSKDATKVTKDEQNAHKQTEEVPISKWEEYKEEFSDFSDDDNDIHPTRRIRWLRTTVLSARKDRQHEPRIVYDVEKEKKRSILKHPVLQMEDPKLLPNVFIIKHCDEVDKGDSQNNSADSS